MGCSGRRSKASRHVYRQVCHGSRQQVRPASMPRTCSQAEKWRVRDLGGALTTCVAVLAKVPYFVLDRSTPVASAAGCRQSTATDAKEKKKKKKKKKVLCVGVTA